MVLVLPDDVTRSLAMDEDAMRVELACRLFQAGRLTLPLARRLAGIERINFEQELKSRGIPAYIIDEEYLAGELAALEIWDRKQ